MNITVLLKDGEYYNLSGLSTKLLKVITNDDESTYIYEGLEYNSEEMSELLIAINKKK